MARITLLTTLLLLQGVAPAFADDEGSDHSAQLVGADADTLGVVVKFDDKAGWTMAVRAKPGAPERTYELTLPRSHAHYVVYVAPERAAIGFVEVSAGVSTQRPKIAASDGLAWIWSPDGKLLHTWSYGQLFSPAELAHLPRSRSHVMWMGSEAVTKAGLELAVTDAKRTVVLDPVKQTLR